MECTRFKTGIFVVIVEKNYPDWICIMATQEKYIPFGLAFLINFKIEPHIGYMSTILSQRIRSITPNSIMTQTNKISCGVNHQSQIRIISKDRYI